MQEIILVDENDKQIGTTNKLTAHQKGQLHRAFSVFIFRKENEKIYLLLQQRNLNKYHSPGLWTNTCCSHPPPNVNLIQAAQKRLAEEMGVHAELTEVGNFVYKANVGNDLIEHEFDHVLIGFVEDTEVPFNKDEVAQYRWIELNQLKTELNSSSNHFTAWFRQAFEIAEIYI